MEKSLAKSMPVTMQFQQINQDKDKLEHLLNAQPSSDFLDGNINMTVLSVTSQGKNVSPKICRFILNLQFSDMSKLTIALLAALFCIILAGLR